MTKLSVDPASRRQALLRLGALALGAYTVPALTTLSVAEAKSSGGGSGGGGGSSSSGSGGGGGSSSSGSSSPSRSSSTGGGTSSSNSTSPSVCSGPTDDDAGCAP